MVLKNKIKLLVFLLCLSATISAQESLTPGKKAKELITNKFPSTRFLDFEYEVLSPSDYDSKLYNEDYESGRIKNINRLRLALNYPVYKTPKFAITPSLRYRYESLRFDRVNNNSIYNPNIYHNNKEDFHYISPSINATYFSKLFDKHVMYTLTVAADASNKGFEHAKAYLLGIMALKGDAQKTMSAGLVLIADKRSSVPVFPIFSYSYKFSGSQWRFDMTLPMYIYFRRPVFSDGHLSLGVSLDTNRFYTYPEYKGLADTYNIEKNEVKIGFLYEHYINKHFILSFRGGAAKGFNWKITEKSSRKSIIKYSPDMNMYFNAGFSYNL